MRTCTQTSNFCTCEQSKFCCSCYRNISFCNSNCTQMQMAEGKNIGIQNSNDAVYSYVCTYMCILLYFIPLLHRIPVSFLLECPLLFLEASLRLILSTISTCYEASVHTLFPLYSPPSLTLHVYNGTHCPVDYSLNRILKLSSLPPNAPFAPLLPFPLL